MLSLPANPHITRTLEFGLHDGKPFLVMECVEGQDLARVLAGGSSASLLWLVATGYAWFGGLRCAQGHDFRYPILGALVAPR